MGACVPACVPAFPRACVPAWCRDRADAEGVLCFACAHVCERACGCGCWRVTVTVTVTVTLCACACVRACVRACVCVCAPGDPRILLAPPPPDRGRRSEC
jgi:hypothetical protein